MDFAGLMGYEKLEFFFDGLLIPCYGSLAKYLQLLWWCSFVDRSCLKFWATFGLLLHGNGVIWEIIGFESPLTPWSYFFLFGRKFCIRIWSEADLSAARIKFQCINEHSSGKKFLSSFGSSNSAKPDYAVSALRRCNL